MDLRLTVQPAFCGMRVSERHTQHFVVVCWSKFGRLHYLSTICLIRSVAQNLKCGTKALAARSALIASFQLSYQEHTKLPGDAIFREAGKQPSVLGGFSVRGLERVLLNVFEKQYCAILLESSNDSYLACFR